MLVLQWEVVIFFIYLFFLIFFHLNKKKKKKGSEVAKEASDIVILDDNFSSITQAIKYGRTIYHSIQKFIVFQSTVNLASALVNFFEFFFF